MPHCPLSDLDKLIFKMLKDGHEFCDHIGHITTFENSVICLRCWAQETKVSSPLGGWALLLQRAQHNIKRYKELKQLWDFIKDPGWKQPQDIIKQETNMAQTYEQGFKEGVKQALDLPFGYAGDYTGDWLLKTINDQRKKLLTKKVTKWTGVITSEWGGKPAILELCDSFEEANGFLLKNPKPLAGPIPIEIEVPL